MARVNAQRSTRRVSVILRLSPQELERVDIAAAAFPVRVSRNEIMRAALLRGIDALVADRRVPAAV